MRRAVAAAEKKAKQLAPERGKGERFSDLARDNSDATTAKAGGALGGYKKGDLAKEFEEAVWNLPKGGVTPADPDSRRLRDLQGGRSHQGRSGVARGSQA